MASIRKDPGLVWVGDVFFRRQNVGFGTQRQDRAQRDGWPGCIDWSPTRNIPVFFVDYFPYRFVSITVAS